MKTPGGKLRYLHIKKRGTPVKCGDCGIKLPGVSSISPDNLDSGIRLCCVCKLEVLGGWEGEGPGKLRVGVVGRAVLGKRERDDPQLPTHAHTHDSRLSH